MLGGVSNVYLVRVSLIEPEKDTPSVSPREDNKKASRDTPIDDEISIKCRGSESLIIQIDRLRAGGVTLPDGSKDKHFSSITSGDTVDQIALVRGMEEFDITTPENEKFNNFFTKYIKKKKETLGKLLVNHCDSITAAEGGATRRHKRLTRRRKRFIGRKGKKSYKKKKYSKTKKSRRFRRSVRSRR